MDGMIRTKNLKVLALWATMAAALVASVLVLSLLEKPAQAQASDDDITVQIVNGEPADQGEYPAQGYLEISFGSSALACGGTLVDTRHILTAAHCVENQGTFAQPQDVKVGLGEVDLNNIGPEDIYGVTKVEPHENYNPVTFQNDIAMLTLDRPASFTPMRVVDSNETSLWEPGDTATVIGWGQTFSGGPGSDTLLEADLPMRSDQDCASAWGSAFDQQTMVCAGNSDISACFGDSGGSLLVPDAEGKFALAGTVSFGPQSCSTAQFPAVFARIGSEPLNSWVHSRIDGDDGGGGGGGSGGGDNGDDGDDGGGGGGHQQQAEHRLVHLIDHLRNKLHHTHDSSNRKQIIKRIDHLRDRLVTSGIGRAQTGAHKGRGVRASVLTNA
jgi:trypsin